MFPLLRRVGHQFREQGVTVMKRVYVLIGPQDMLAEIARMLRDFDEYNARPPRNGAGHWAADPDSYQNSPEHEGHLEEHPPFGPPYM